jgi:putative transcriptional regulator
MAVKNKLEEILNERGIKQNWLANKCGLSKQTLSNAINNRHNVSLEAAIRIARSLDIYVEDIFSIDD